MSVIRSQCVSDAEYIKSLRDDFAAKAMQALVSARCGRGLPSDAVPDFVTSRAYDIADHMLAARESKP